MFTASPLNLSQNFPPLLRQKNEWSFPYPKPFFKVIGKSLCPAIWNSVLVPQMLFPRESIHGSVTKRRLFSQAIANLRLHLYQAHVQ